MSKQNLACALACQTNGDRAVGRMGVFGLPPA